MQSWPSKHLTALANHSFPPLSLNDSTLGLINLNQHEDFRIYVCGVTPYDATHLGHAATYLAFDLINRYQVLAGKELNFVENITDVDDPLLVRAKRDGVNWKQLANEQIDLYRSDMSALRVLPPQSFVRVTDSMEIIENFIRKLQINGHIYQLEGDFYFSVSNFLDHLPLSIAEAVGIFAERGGDPERNGKKHKLDPLIWAANNGDDPGWHSSFGYGRPGWHVECTAIACHYLDEQKKNPMIHVQGGGSDLIFPHHFMSAQIIKAAYGRNFAEHFIHAAMIGLDGEKMSKSKGNLVFVSKLLEEGVDPMVIRWALLSGHYQQDRYWSNELLIKAQSEIDLLRSVLAQNEVAPSQPLIESLINDLANNLDTPSAFKRLLAWAKSSQANPSINESGVVSRAIESLLGLAL